MPALAPVIKAADFLSMRASARGSPLGRERCAVECKKRVRSRSRARGINFDATTVRRLKTPLTRTGTLFITARIASSATCLGSDHINGGTEAATAAMPLLLDISVFMNPGHREVTWTPVPTSSSPMPSENGIRKALEALYMASRIPPDMMPQTEETL